jgi:CRP/FNR family cyclic AMP-dependent transcriptional regulator
MVSTQDLKEFGLFHGLDGSELAKIAKLCNERTLDEGTLLFDQGKGAKELHLCRSGKVDITVRLREPWGIEITVHKAGGGEVFGWSSLVEPYRYTASAKIIERTEDISIKASALNKLFEENTRIGYIFMRNLSAVISSRLTEYRQKLSVEIAATIKKEW